MQVFTAVVEKCPDTGLYVGYVPGFPGAHTQGKMLDELNNNLREVIEMLLEDGFPKLEAEFVGTQTGTDISPILLRQICKDIGLTGDEFIHKR